MEPFVSQLADLCRAHPTRAKWVFVPAHGVGHTLGDRLALDGTDWANLRFVTPLDIALRMGAPFLVERGIDPSEEGLGPALMMRLLLGLSDAHEYFRPQAHQPELARAMWSTVTELRMAGVASGDLKAEAFSSPAKHAELEALLAAYERFLVENKRGDRATVLTEALRHPDWCPVQQQDCWTAMPDTVWSALERHLIDSMPGERIVPATLAIPGASIPRRLARQQTTRVHPSSTAPMAYLLAPESRPEAKIDADFFVAGGAEAEIEEVFRRILASGEPLDQIEICVASPSSRPLLWEKALRYEWPVTMADGLPAAMTKPGRALLALTAWIEDDFAAGRLRKLLQSGDVVISPGKRKRGDLTPGRAARLLVKAEAAWGRKTYRLALGRLAHVSRTSAGRDDIADDEREALLKRAEQCDEVAAWISALIDQIPEPASAGASLPLKTVVDCAIHFVRCYAAKTSALDHASAEAIVSALAELHALGDFECPLTQALRFLNERVDSVQIGADRPRPGHLFVSNLRRAAFSHRRRLFVIGLEEGRVFPSSYEDPILLDFEREATSADMARSADRIDEAVFLAVSRLAVASAGSDVSITFSYSCRDLREYRETYASWLMLQAYRVTSGNTAARYDALRKHTGPPKSCVPLFIDDSLDASRWWLHGVTRAGAASRSNVLGHYPMLESGVRAEEARSSAAFTEFDGHVPAAGPVLDPAAADRVVSATQLEDAAKCPFRYLLRRGLQVDAIEAGDRDRDVWLTPLLRGSLLHDIYARLMRRCRDEKRAVNATPDMEWMIQQGAAELARVADEMPPPSDEVRERETSLFLDDLCLFVQAEADVKGSTPVGFEVAFGRGAKDGADAEPLASNEPVTIPLGNGLALRIAGRIDRIDRIDQPGAPEKSLEFEIIDYKTGGFWKDDWQGTFAGGTRLQHALYGFAATELIRRTHAGAKIARATYYFSSTKGQQTRKEIGAQPLAKVTEVLTDLRSVITNGLFIHATDERTCSWCNYGQACGRSPHKRAAAKQGDAALAPFRKLVAHD